MIRALQKLWRLLTPAEKVKFYILAAMMITGAYLELLGIGLIMPVIALLTNAELINQNKIMHFIYSALDPPDIKSFVLVLCLLVAATYILKNIFLMMLTHAQAKYIYTKSLDLSSHLFHSYVFAPYSFHLGRNSSEMLTNFSMIHSIVAGVLMSFMLILTELANVILIFAALFFFTPFVTLVLVLGVAAVMLLFYFPLKRLNTRLSEDSYNYIRLENKNISETFTSIKEIKLQCAENIFYERNRIYKKGSSDTGGKIYFYSQFPRFMIEMIAVCGAMTILAVFIIFDMATSSIVLKLSLIALAMVRLMPSFSRLQYNFSAMRSMHCSFDNVINDICNIPPEELNDSGGKLSFRESIKVENLSFSYGAGARTLDDVSLEIRKNSSTAFIGRTGCGKTTLADIITGLLKPDSGRVLVDGVDIRTNLTSWRKSIGYVPQSIHLFDDTVAANIAFGITPDKIDMSKIEEALKLAQLYDFVDGLPEKLNTVIGESGVRLSGGQRQRLGIARALYNTPEILILDEATSALDNETERAFMDAVELLHGKLTLIIIAHRMTTTKGCDAIIDLSKKNMKT